MPVNYKVFQICIARVWSVPGLGWASRLSRFGGRGISFLSLRKLLTSYHQYFAEDAQGPLCRPECSRHSSAVMVAPFLCSPGPPGLLALLLHLFLLGNSLRYQTSTVELTCLLLSWGSPAWPPDAEHCDFLCFSSFLSCFRWEGKYEPLYSLLARSETV